MNRIRIYQKHDWSAVWSILKPVFRSGEFYVFSTDITEQEAQHIWIELPTNTYVVTDTSGEIIGTYYLKPNQPGLGSHVCNCGYIVSRNAQGKGIASQMCIHSQQVAVSTGYKSMQYNLVVSSNEDAISLWKKHGFEIVGTLPEAFHHPKLGYINAFVMNKQLEP